MVADLVPRLPLIHRVILLAERMSIPVT
jgi:hypothetical protein